MQAFRKPTGKWNEIARRYRRLLESYRGSPPIEFEGHRYVIVEYFSVFMSGGFPEIPIKGFLVIRDRREVVADPRVVCTIARAGYALRICTHDPVIVRIENDADYDYHVEGYRSYIQTPKQFTQAVARVDNDERMFHFLQLLDQVVEALDGKARSTRRMLQILGRVLQDQVIDVRLIEGLLNLLREDESYAVARNAGAGEAAIVADEIVSALRATESRSKGKKIKLAISWLKGFSSAQKLYRGEREQIKPTLDRDLANWCQKAVQHYRAPLRGHTGQKIEPYLVRGVEEVMAALPAFETHPLWPPPKHAKRRREKKLARMTLGCLLVGLAATLLLVVFAIFTLGPSVGYIAMAVVLLSSSVALLTQLRNT